MASEAFRPQWGWPSGVNSQANREATTPAVDEQTRRAASSSNPPSSGPTPTQRQRQRHYKPRTCRICLEVVYPTTDIDDSLAGRVFSSKARVRYVSEDPELGRLMSPCKCKGSQKYVHEGCLRAWRNAAPLSDRNYWRCPTCQFEYRLERLRWGRWLSSKVLRVTLTVAILVFTVFILGFIADPIIGFWEDPFGSLVGGLLDIDFDYDEPVLPDEGPGSWSLHFLKGFLSLGLLGFLKTMYFMSPWHWFNIRFGGYRRRRGTGRDRLEQINWGLVLVGVLTFLGATWKFVNHLMAKTLEKASDRVVDVQEDDPDDDEADDVPGDAAPETATNESKKDR
ncbi:uncharacterized protein P884DRAFT_283041 [Thermothelomyces heterothallicus CBS 202.75]|uniref:uncharacterized protein n=1 Tax=Thermothelomyces heterothallicus CBS 202.75 TaxID=1149848 RepID=UPI0037424843